MAKFLAQVEQAQDGTWTATVLGQHTVFGTGDSRDAALEDLRSGILGLLEYLAAKGLPLLDQSVEYVSVEGPT